MRRVQDYRGFYEDEYMTIALKPNGVVVRAVVGYVLVWRGGINVLNYPKPQDFEDGLTTFWAYKKRGLDRYGEAIAAKKVWLRCVNMHLAGVLWVDNGLDDNDEEERQAYMGDKND